MISSDRELEGDIAAGKEREKEGRGEKWMVGNFASKQRINRCKPTSSLGRLDP